MNRVVAGAIGLIAGAAVLVGCSDDKGGSTTSSVSSGGGTVVKVDGKDLAGLDTGTVSCVKQGGRINVGSAPIGGQQGVGIVMTDEATPKVESLGMVVDGSALAVTNTMGAQVGKAEVKVDGSTYTVTGEASGADLKNPMAGMITKPFTVTVTCK